ncbi:hypothetical protein Curi_c22400 [Gottschalkia acidurici 9a]|uniref:Uncharacterized protein n=1 Tax=Gottschalkia acidurici (strain ATCC 7906 / DSM 604 / BCRC 14475 / CIP 104303 / KCTC 5404 / NCIMB 10678 / 9a) TaxID=1128398 RepID=K0AZL7_GOTA9|nr:KOW domain-containing RNA-binding protein [Gottschalkia acidurici]AFS79243.1 hypothetical protein Curi_c22400 [Gottschalkia acidurici 9a]
METTTDINLGQIVKSKAGRDKDKIFTVIDIVDEDYILIVDGKYRKLDNPKKKKIKHLMVYKNVLGDLKEKIARNEINNSYIRKELAPFNK